MTAADRGARRRAAAHLLVGLGQPSDGIVSVLDGDDLTGDAGAPWRIVNGTIVAERALTSASHSIEPSPGGAVVRLEHDLVGWIATHLACGHDGVRDRLGRPAAGDVSGWARPWVDLASATLAAALRAAAEQLGVVWIELARWPGDRPYAMNVTHDIDALFEREAFTVAHNALAVLRPERDMLSSRRVAAARLARSVVRPMDPMRPVRRLLQIERDNAITATYFVLLDTRWSRHGARYRLDQRAVRTMIDEVRAAGHEVGLHTGVSYYADGAGVRAWADRLRGGGADVTSARGHYLSFDHLRSFDHLVGAGIRNDATLGLPFASGFRAGSSLPFVASSTADGAPGAYEVPLALMDVAVFREQVEPSSVVRRVHADVRATNGLLSVLWHNTYAGVDEYRHVEQLMCALIDDASRDGAWMASTAQTAAWCAARDRTIVRADADGLVVDAPGGHDIVVRVHGAGGASRIGVRAGSSERIGRGADASRR